jgi:alkylation response protein AidB-like acyl-CoA dehydrogenase
MDIALSETQSLLRDAIRDYLEKEVPFDRVRQLERDGGYDRELWQYLQSAGFLGLPFPENLGGDAGELSDLAVLLEELTRRASVIPFMETMISALAVQRHGEQAVAAEIVKGVIAGSMTISPAILEANDRFDDFSLAVAGGKITGDKYFVDYGHVVTHHLVAAKEGGKIALYLVDANSADVSAKPLRNIGRTPQANISYKGAAARKAGGEEAFRFLVRAGRTLAAIQCVGNSQQALDMTVEYVSMRVQFGRPIGTFQAVQHHCANMATMVLSSRFLAYEAVWHLDHGNATDKAIAIAKAQASRTATEVPMMAHQLYGGIGFTEEYDLHFFSRHGKERSISWGTTEECLREVAGSIEEAEAWL